MPARKLGPSGRGDGLTLDRRLEEKRGALSLASSTVRRTSAWHERPPPSVAFAATVCSASASRSNAARGARPAPAPRPRPVAVVPVRWSRWNLSALLPCRLKEICPLAPASGSEAATFSTKDVDVDGDRRLRLAVGGRDLERVAVPDLAVQSLLHDQAPLALVLLDDGKLAQRVAVCTARREHVTEVTPSARRGENTLLRSRRLHGEERTRY
ncbi:hypothetical protein EYF80_042602 [Liparis tanakae]|uniref:Uncharacterized protein n=1 Tax=Liparis tanakae TaxID=230148 RepID=A0A4Z2G1S7_9TELE|nr:hypothetical protein EYF80_042602 [Liparis tanakae]